MKFYEKPNAELIRFQEEEKIMVEQDARDEARDGGLTLNGIIGYSLRSNSTAT
jgi:hypothetical protein